MLILCQAVTLAVGSDNSGQDRTSEPPGISILDAVRSTLELNPMLQYQQQQVVISRAVKQQASGDFDTVLQSSAGQTRTNNPLSDAERLLALQSGIDTNNEVTNLTSVTGSAQRLLRSGVVIGPRVEMTRTTDNVESPDGLSRTRLSFEVLVPLWRGKGRAVVTARETSAELGVEASLYDLNQTIAELVLTTAVDYWQYVGALRQLAIITESEERGKEFVESVQALIKADRIPGNEINQVNANFASRTAGRILIEQQVVESRNALALAMGLSAAQMMNLPMPSDSFPDGEQQVMPSISSESIRSHIEDALKHRADILSAEKNIQAADVLLGSAKNSLLPQLDMTLSTGYAGLHEGRRPDQFLVSPFTHAHGADLLLGLQYSFPRANNLALGRVAEAGASYEQSLLLRSEKAQTIANGIANTLTAVYNTNQRLKKASEAVNGYRAALEGEKDKLRLGAGSLTDLLTVEGRMTDALLDLVDAQRSYAIALVQYRFASGTLVAPDRTVQSMERELFFTPPK